MGFRIHNTENRIQDTEDRRKMEEYSTTWSLEIGTLNLAVRQADFKL
ncbi:MAG: hypothetical protein KAR57_07250 [Bacteroidales bacterium]|nr:hypothetical protein [Bacteroidales bacterium]